MRFSERSDFMGLFETLKAKAGISGTHDDTIFLEGLGFAGPALIKGIGDIPDYQVVVNYQDGKRQTSYMGSDLNEATLRYFNMLYPNAKSVWFFDHGKRTKTREINQKGFDITKARIPGKKSKGLGDLIKGIGYIPDYQVIVVSADGTKRITYEGTVLADAENYYAQNPAEGKSMWFMDHGTRTKTRSINPPLPGADSYQVTGYDKRGKSQSLYQGSDQAIALAKYDYATKTQGGGWWTKVVMINTTKSRELKTWTAPIAPTPPTTPAPTETKTIETGTKLETQYDGGTGYVQPNLLQQLQNSIQGGIGTVTNLPTTHKAVAVIGLAGAIGGFAFLILRKKK